MNISSIKNPISNIISKPRLLGPVVFLGVGTFKTLKDYHDAKPEHKSRILLKNTAILAGTAAAFAVVSPLTRLFCHTKFVNLFVKGAKTIAAKVRRVSTGQNSAAMEKTQKFFENTEHIIKEAIAGTINTFAGIAGAVYSNELMHKYVFIKPHFKVEVKNEKDSNEPETKSNKHTYFQNSTVFSKFDYVNSDFAKQTANRMFSTLSDIPDMKILEKPMIALTGFSVANTKGYHNKLKKTTYELLANTLIPTIFVSAMTLAVQNKSPMKKYPALFAALTLGAAVGILTADKMKEKINITIDGIDMKYIVV